MSGEHIQRSFGGGRPSKVSGRVADPHAFWPTPAECPVALMRFLAEHEPEALNEARIGGIADLCCGDGAIARVLEAMGFAVHASDLVDRGYGRGGVDFLTTEPPPARVLVMNIPFNQIPAFIERARQLRRVTLVAFLMPAGFWFGAGRNPPGSRMALFDSWRPSWILHMCWRPDFTGGGAGTMQLDWVVWSVWSRSSQGCGGDARTRLLPRPDLSGGLWA